MDKGEIRYSPDYQPHPPRRKLVLPIIKDGPELPADFGTHGPQPNVEGMLNAVEIASMKAELAALRKVAEAARRWDQTLGVLDRITLQRELAALDAVKGGPHGATRG